MKDLIKKYKYGIISIIICVIASIICFIAKRDFHIDESLSYSLANSPTGLVSFETYGWYEKSLWSQYIPDSLFDYNRVYQNQYWDVHPPLYYYVLHTICSIFNKSFSLWHAFSINLVFFFLSLLMFYKISYKFTDNDLFSGTGILLYGLNKKILSNVIFLRMYVMSSFFVLLFLWCALKIITNEGKLKNNLIGLFITTIFGGLTHYQFYMIVACLSLTVAIYLIIKREWKELVLSFLSVLLAGLINVFILFRGTLFHLSNTSSSAGHVGNALEGLVSLNIDSVKLDYFLRGTWGGIWGLCLLVGLLVAVIFLNIRKKNIKYSIAIILIVTYFLGFLVLTKTSTYLSYRYLSHLESIGVLGILFSFYLIYTNIDNKKIGIVIYLLLTAMIVKNIDFSEVVTNISTTPSWTYAKEHQDSVAYVIIDYDLEDRDVNVLFNNLMYYKKTGITHLGQDLTCDEDNNYVLYIDYRLNQEECLNYIKSQLTYKDKELVIEKLDIINKNFEIYSASFK